MDKKVAVQIYKYLPIAKNKNTLQNIFCGALNSEDHEIWIYTYTMSNYKF